MVRQGAEPNGDKIMIAMFNSVKAFAVFNAKPHLFAYGAPYQIGESSAKDPVFVEFKSGSEEQFAARVEQFNGVVLCNG